MDGNSDFNSALTLGVWLLVHILNVQQEIVLVPADIEEEQGTVALDRIIENVAQPLENPLASMRSRLEAFRCCTSLIVLSDDLGYWVKPRSTTWFSQFLMSEYDDTRWLEMFRMPKQTVFALADLLSPRIQREDTKYRLAIPIVIRVACTLFKLTHGVSFFICSEMFAIGKSTVCAIIKDVVHAINDTLRHQITWPTGERLRLTQQKFANLCGLPGVVGAIDGTHVAIAKPRHVPVEYYYFKSGGYSLNCQAVVDSDKRFLDLYLGMPGSTNDSRVLRRSSLYDLATRSNFFNNSPTIDGFTSYLLGDSSYPLLPWLMVPHRGNVRLSLAESLFNKRLRKGRCVVENAFGILKQTFRELLQKSDLDVAFLPDVIMCCAILHNMLLGQPEEDVQNLYGILQNEGLGREEVDNGVGDNDILVRVWMQPLKLPGLLPQSRNGNCWACNSVYKGRINRSFQVMLQVAKRGGELQTATLLHGFHSMRQGHSTEAMQPWSGRRRRRSLQNFSSSRHAIL